jgi:hypothetical protein
MGSAEAASLTGAYQAESLLDFTPLLKSYSRIQVGDN